MTGHMSVCLLEGYIAACFAYTNSNDEDANKVVVLRKHLHTLLFIAGCCLLHLWSCTDFGQSFSSLFKELIDVFLYLSKHKLGSTG